MVSSVQSAARRTRVVFAIVCGVVLLVTSSPVAAYAVGETIAVTLSAKDGTAPFDASDGAGTGHDSSATNRIVRTNDNVTYTVNVSVNGGSAANTTITLTAPQGQEFVSIPPFCASGSSSLTPTNPQAPSTYAQLKVQTLTCNVGSISSGTAAAYDFVTRVRAEAPDGTSLIARDGSGNPLTIDGNQYNLVASVTSDAVTTPVTSTPVPPITVAARAQYDLSKNGVASTPDSGWMSDAAVPCTTTTGSCFLKDFPITISAPTGGKGISPLSGAVTLTDDLSPSALYGSTVTSSSAYQASSDPLGDFGGRVVTCKDPDWGGIPGPGGSTASRVTDVRDNGDTECTQAGGPGTPVSVTITNADWTATTYPSKTLDGSTIPADRAYVYSMVLRVEIPAGAASALGTTSGTKSTLAAKNTLTQFTAKDISGRSNDPAADPADDDYRSFTLVTESSGGFDVAFVGVPNAPGNTPPPQWVDWWGGPWEGPAAGTDYNSGDGMLHAGGETISNIFIDTKSTNNLPSSFVLCNSWNPAQVNLTRMTTTTWASTHSGTELLGQKYPANNEAVWLSGYWSEGTGRADPPTNFTVQYGTGAGGPDNTSRCDSGTW